MIDDALIIYITPAEARCLRCTWNQPGYYPHAIFEHADTHVPRRENP